MAFSAMENVVDRNSPMGKLLGELYACIFSTNYEERKRVVHVLQDILKKKRNGDNVVLDWLLAALPSMLRQYEDSKSRRIGADLFRVFLAKNPKSTLDLVKGFHEAAMRMKTLHATRSLAQRCLTALAWLCVLLTDDVQDTVQVETVGVLLYKICESGCPQLMRKAGRRLRFAWTTSDQLVSRFRLRLAKAEATGPSVVLGSVLLSFLVDRDLERHVEAHKVSALETFAKAVVGGKSRPERFLLRCGDVILERVTDDEFSRLLLPAVCKAMLRAPEISLECVAHVLSALRLDLSKYALEMGRALATHLRSTDSSCRDNAAVAMRHLAERCGEDSASIDDLLRHLVSVLNGCEGKLTLSSQRASLVAGMGALAANSASASSNQKWAAVASDSLVLILQQEVHESTLTQILSSLSSWADKFSESVPEKLLTWFPKGFNSKTSTVAVQTGYLRCADAALNRETIRHATVFAPMIGATMDKLAASGNPPAPLVAQALAALCLFVKICAAEDKYGSQMTSLWPILLDGEKQPFAADKFIYTAPEEAVVQLAVVVRRLFMSFPQKLKTAGRNLPRAAVKALLHPSRAVRDRCLEVLSRLLSSPGASELSLSLLVELSFLLKDRKTKVHGHDVPVPEAASEVETVPSLRACHVARVVRLLCAVDPAAKKSNSAIVVEALTCCHHPSLLVCYPNLWERVCELTGLVPSEVVRKNCNKLWKEIVSERPLQEISANIAKTMCRLAPKEFLSNLMAFVLKELADESAFAVTDREYDIFNAKDGELCDGSAIENLREVIVPDKNVKRESKAYSFKDQMEEMELRKELEAKKKKDGERRVAELTPKQREALRSQLAKESEIRKRLKERYSCLEHVDRLVAAATEGNPKAVGFHCCRIIPLVVNLASSPLARDKACSMYLGLRKCALTGEAAGAALGDALALLTLELVALPAAKLPAKRAESTSKTVKRRLEHLVGGKLAEKETSFGGAKKGSRPMSAPAFAYVFPFLEVLLYSGKVYGIAQDNLLDNALQFVLLHAQLRDASETDGDADECSPEFLPRLEMLKVLVHVCDNLSGRLQFTATKALVEVARASCGDIGCAMASDREVGVLLRALQSGAAGTRKAAIDALACLADLLKSGKETKQGFQTLARVWIARFDPEDGVARTADSLWEQLEADPPPSTLSSALLTDVTHDQAAVRISAADGLAALVQYHEREISGAIKNLLTTYRKLLVIPPPVLDDFGRVVSEAPPDRWQGRSGIALALCAIVKRLDRDEAVKLMTFFVEESLGDRNDQVRAGMLEAAIAIVDGHGTQSVNSLLPLLERVLVSAPNTVSFDCVRQSVVVLIGTLARHFPKEDPRLKPIVTRLIETLSTPSQQVQEAVANCLPPLIAAVKDEAAPLTRKLLQQLLESENYGERKGAAYGIAGIVKGIGILALKQLDIMRTLTEAVQDKKEFRRREGALFAFETLCHTLGRLFEPYVVHVLPHLLLCYGDSSHQVREATNATSRAVMSKLSAHGVKLVLPSLLAALEEDSWRTKIGSIELLGSMAFCAPKQLSSCLPSIVPKLIEVLSDSHVRVQKGGGQALRRIGSVIRNPEIQALVPVLLDALQEPSKKTANCLQRLLDTKFVHFVDAPSLALIVPVVQRALQDRSTETRKMAAEIIGNMYSLTDQKDLAPYLPTVLPGLKQSLQDPVPEVRGVASRALGAMVKGLGESCFEDLLPWLMQTLTSEGSPVDRSGAAQGLSEVVGGLGVEKLRALMPDIIATAERSDVAPHVKDGYIMLFIYLPGVFQEEFIPYIGQIIVPILKALADENEFVRDTALRAGQRMVHLYADNAIALLLPELEKGLFDENWRIRYSSVQLLGDLLYKISGVSGKMTTQSVDEDDNFGTEHSHKAIMLTLGSERRNRVLSGLYMGRSDVALMVRQASLHVWKIVVTNTPKTLREILPTLFTLLLGCLASKSYDKRQVAARTLGDLVRKLGERVLPEIIPILEKGLESDKADQRQGVCVGLGEILASTSRDMVLTFVDNLVPTVRKALCDPLPEVRLAAAKTFESLHNTVGVRALEEILPPLLKQLDDPVVGERTLQGLRQVMTVKGRVVLPYIVPQLTAHPVNTAALSVLASVAGEALSKHLSKILPALLAALTEAIDTPSEAEVLSRCEAVLLSVGEPQGVRAALDELLEAAKSHEAARRRAAVLLLCAFCSRTKADYKQDVPQLLRGLLRMFNDEDDAVLLLAWETLSAVVKNLDGKEQQEQVGNLRQAVRFAAGDLGGKTLLPGFCLPKGISPLVPIFREAILNGTPELKEQASMGLGEVISLTGPESLKSSLVNITGPLIRVLGDRYNWNVRVAVLDTLAVLLSKVGAMLKPFLPQLQTTFLKALCDQNRLVRLKSATALGHLVVIHPRADSLFVELHAHVRNSEDNSIKETMLQALRGIVTPAGDKMSDAVRSSVLATLQSLLSSQEDSIRVAAAGCLGALSRWTRDNEFRLFCDGVTGDDASTDLTLRHGQSVALTVALSENAPRLLRVATSERVVESLLANLVSEKLPVVLSAVRGCGFFLRHVVVEGATAPPPLVQALAKCMNHAANEVKLLVTQVVNFLTKCAAPGVVPDTILKTLVPMLVNGTKEKNSAVRSGSEAALASVLKLRRGEETYQAVLKILDAGAREALADAVAKVLRRVSNLPEPRAEQLDDSLLCS